MELFCLKRSMMSEVPEVEDLLDRLNMKRSAAAVAVILAVLLTNVASGVIRRHSAYVLGNIFVGLWCVLFVLYILFYNKSPYSHPRLAQRSCLFFWAALGIAMLPFQLGDMQTWGLPVNMLLLHALLLAGPFFMLWEAVVVQGIYYLVYLIAFFSIDGSGLQLAYVSLLAAATLFLCQQSHGQYVQQVIHIKKEANYDYLTGLMNRQSGMEKMKRIYDRCRYKHWMMGILMVDIDYFKEYNDHFGHVQGDCALKKIGQCMNECFNRPEDMVCRLGGEEFLICFSCADKKTIVENGKRLYDGVKGMGIKSCSGGNLTVSIGGMGIVPAKGDKEPDLLCLVDRCDKLLYQAKREGKDQIVYDQAVTA
jgi:diguanylate cyclase (GGDEF)-like protein